MYYDVFEALLDASGDALRRGRPRPCRLLRRLRRLHCCLRRHPHPRPHPRPHSHPHPHRRLRCSLPITFSLKSILVASASYASSLGVRIVDNDADGGRRS
jgi:hypothetical protein